MPQGKGEEAGHLIGLVIVAHGDLASALLAATEHVVGPQEYVRAVAIEPMDDLRARQAEINRLVEEVDTGAGVVLITDMFGGTPSNLALGAINGELSVGFVRSSGEYRVNMARSGQMHPVFMEI